MLKQSELKKLLHYDPKTGIFTWVHPKSYKVKHGQKAGSIDSYGYIIIKISSKRLKSHRLAWLYMTGELPKQQIDHKNHNRTDNRWCNLRDIPQAEQQKNMSLRKTNTSGINGVFSINASSKWTAQIGVNNTMIHLGTFESKEEAAKARRQADIKYGFHKNHGKEITML